MFTHLESYIKLYNRRANHFKIYCTIMMVLSGLLSFGMFRLYHIRGLNDWALFAFGLFTLIVFILVLCSWPSKRATLEKALNDWGKNTEEGRKTVKDGLDMHARAGVMLKGPNGEISDLFKDLDPNTWPLK